MNKRSGTLTLLSLALIASIGIFHSLSKQEIVEKNELSIFEKQLAEKQAKRKAGYVKADLPDMHALIQRELRTREGDAGPKYGPNQVAEEYLKAKSSMKKSARSADTQSFDFVERGPGNVAGRTRSLIVDPDDATNNTWFAGSASGGIWKTTDGGSNWAFISEDIPNLGTNTLAMSAANSSVIYAGTGEHFTNDIDGSGLYKTTDKGQTWMQIADPSIYTDFKNISRIVVDPADEDVVIVTSRNSVWSTSGLAAAIYKTTDGGTNWTQLRSSTTQRYDDIAYASDDFNTLYVAVNNIGVIKSTDGGTTWDDSSVGMTPGGRVEIAISPVNSSRLWASVQGSVSGNASDLYVSSDAGATWGIALNANGAENEDFLGGQGWYDNYATAHPIDEDIVYVGGVNNWKFELGTGAGTTSQSIGTSENGTEAFMSYINFGGAHLGGGMDIGTVAQEDLLPVEIRFGAGTQKAHRYTVNGQGPGVANAGYLYQDYVDVPFQAWDTENNQQLMVSFRDQQEDGAWNLIANNTDGDGSTHSREYFFIHNVAYSETADPNIGQDGGRDTEQMYFFWPVLANGATFDKDNLPVSNLAVEIVTIQGVERITTNISDAYNDFGGRNNFGSQGTRSSGIHPDQHNLIMYNVDEGAGTFGFLITNDGGVYESVTSTDPGTSNDAFTYVSSGYNTTQFYGADKAPGEDRYIGGMQDNGTWYHAPGLEGSASAEATFGIGGDGFEALWHSGDVNKIIGGSQFNNFAKTENGGQTWVGTSGFTDNGPFITRLAHNKTRPDHVFTVGNTGVWKSTNFGSTWAKATMNDPTLWSFSNSADVEVSYANADVIWAGAALSSTTRLAVSTDGGDTFDAVENYAAFNMGSSSGIGTHPSDDEVAYALFSFSGFPKVIKTTDLGQTWEDISGFDGTGDRGFPDVAVNTIFVFPTDENRIWVGSEIGIVESLDGGASWGLLDSNMPAVNVYDFKLTENQLVIATYGRGMWSVTLSDVLIAPTVQSAFMSPDGMVNFTINYSAQFDSTEVYLAETYISTIYDNELGELAQTLQNQGLEGSVNLGLRSYKNGVRYNAEAGVFVFQVNEAAESYGTTFTDAGSDFVGTDLRLGGETGFDGDALHSPHPYLDGNVELISYLRTPVTVAATDATFYYEDIAIVETGENGSVFPEQDFYDYVVVEASTDGFTWVALEPGYDASLHQDWLDAYNNSEDGNPDLFESHTINLLDHFEAGDVVLVRFRLHSDPNTVGYGWVVDNLYVQEEVPDPPLGTLSVEGKLQIFPNPIGEVTTIEFNGMELTSNIEVFTIGGKMVAEIKSSKREASITWRPNNLDAGVYVMRYQVNGKEQSQKVLIK